MPKPHRKKKRQQTPPQPTETAAAEALTSAWTLTVMTVLLCDVGAGLARLYFNARPDAAMIAVLSGMLLFAAAAIGIISMLLLALVVRVRRELPPRGFVVFSLVVAVAPLLALAAQRFG